MKLGVVVIISMAVGIVMGIGMGVGVSVGIGVDRLCIIKLQLTSSINI